MNGWAKEIQAQKAIYHNSQTNTRQATEDLLEIAFKSLFAAADSLGIDLMHIQDNYEGKGELSL